MTEDALDFESLINSVEISNDTEKTGGQPLAEEGNKLTIKSLSDDSLIPELNWTDPIVYHDPLIKPKTIAKAYEQHNNVNKQGPGLGTEEKEESSQVNGVFYPILLVNNRVIGNNDVLNMRLDYDTFYPTIYLEIIDAKNAIKELDAPTSMNTHIGLIMLPSIEGVYRKIALDFIITSTSFDDGVVTYTGEYYVKELKQTHTEQLKFGGCPALKCSMPKQDILSTWEYFHVISQKCGLGFAATKDCKTINDRLPRRLTSESYEDFILNQIKFSGLDENSIFDCWIDLYGYLVLVNVAWVMASDITYRHLSIVTTTGPNVPVEDVPQNMPAVTHRTITNFNLNEKISDLEVQKYEDIISNFDIQEKGTNIVHPKILQPGLDTFDAGSVNYGGVAAADYTFAGLKSSNYVQEKHAPFTFQCTEYNIDIQEDIRTMFFLNRCRTKIKVRMKNANFGLQRGTLLNFVWFTDDPILKQKFLETTSNLDGKQTSKPDNLELPNDKGKIIQNEGPMIPNLSVSGLWYIDGMTFEYENGNDEIDQTLILIKKGPRNNFNSPAVVPRIHEDVFGTASGGSTSGATTIDAISASGMPIIDNVVSEEETKNKWVEENKSYEPLIKNVILDTQSINGVDIKIPKFTV